MSKWKDPDASVMNAVCPDPKAENTFPHCCREPHKLIRMNSPTQNIDTSYQVYMSSIVVLVEEGDKKSKNHTEHLGL